MKKTSSLLFLKLLMWLIAGMHIVVGGGFNVSSSFAPFMVQVYGADVQWTPELSYIVKPLGAFMCALGILAVAAALNPLRYRVITYGFVFLFLARALQRLVWGREVQAAFGISASRNVANMVFFAFLAAAIFVLDRFAHAQASTVVEASPET